MRWTYPKKHFSTIKAFRTVLCYSFNVKMPSCSDQTAATAAFMLSSLAVARNTKNHLFLCFFFIFF